MKSIVDALAEAVAAVRELWPGEQIEGAAPAALVAATGAIGRARRLMDAASAQLAAEISRQSRPELGPDGLAKAQGFRNATTLLAAALGTTNGEAARLVQVGDATAPRVLLTGDRAPARHPHVAAALAVGAIGAAAAAAIIAMLDRVALRAAAGASDEAERILVAQAPGLSIDQLAKVIARAEAYLDPDGVAPREDELRAQRSLRIRQDRTGMVEFVGRFDPESAAPVVTAIEAIVSAELAATRDTPRDPESGDSGSGDSDVPRRSIPTMQADALSLICAHALECSHRELPTRGATVVVRVGLDDLRAGTGHATIDGLTAPVSIATARRMAAANGVIPCVLGGNGEILDWGRAKRLFTRQQKLALIERDGGCAMCGAPPGHAKVHHIRWWARDHGPTDLSNGILLCVSCHHRIHDNGWDIRIDGAGIDAEVWFIPPVHVDARQRPRLGGRRRYDYAA